MNDKCSPYVYPGTFRRVPLAPPEETPNPATSGRLLPEQIVRLVAEYYKIPFERMGWKTREQRYVVARHMAWHFMRRYCVPQPSLKVCGKIFGDFDHTSVIHGLRTVENRSANESKYSFQYTQIKAFVNANLTTEPPNYNPKTIAPQ